MQASRHRNWCFLSFFLFFSGPPHPIIYHIWVILQVKFLSNQILPLLQLLPYYTKFISSNAWILIIASWLGYMLSHLSFLSLTQQLHNNLLKNLVWSSYSVFKTTNHSPWPRGQHLNNLICAPPPELYFFWPSQTYFPGVSSSQTELILSHLLSNH